MDKLHIISHSHWDREWYMSFEQHRLRLVELMDALIETMENNPDYKYFHLDGQYIVIEDYLQIKPYMRERLTRLIQEDRIQIGPWYILQDEYLTSGEANVRNMLVGLKLCRELGAKPVMSGYFPDAFGNISQAPQILAGFGIDNAIFGRGIGELKADNQIAEGAVSNPSELIWESPDGTQVIGVMFSHWYNNACELPIDDGQLKEKIQELVESTRECAQTPELLGMNGCDHQPVQTNLAEVLDKAKQYLPEDVEILHSNFKDYLEAVRPYRDKFPVLKGEINGQRTNGSFLLISTASTHVPLKQMNHQAQNALEQQAEPISVLSYLAGDQYREDFLLYAWKTLMENHPHDSICTCSADEVAREMVTRFQKSIQVADLVRDEAKDYLCANIDTKGLADKNIVVFHTSPLTTTEVVTVYVDYDKEETVGALSVVDTEGNPIPAVIKPLGETFTYTLPKDSFRKVKYVNRYEVRLLVTASGIGYQTYLVKNSAAQQESLITVNERGAENDTIRFTIEKNGSLTVTNKKTGDTYAGLNIYEDTGDKGEGYNYRPTEDQTATTTECDTAKVWVQEQTPFSVTFGIENTMLIPAGLDGQKRSADTVAHTITTFATLTYGIDRIDIQTKVNNQSENHRLRALFMPEIQTDTALADGQFDLISREIQPWEGWENPANCQRHQSFFALEDASKGLLVAGRGLHEYEILRDGKNTMALTLLRCVGEIGDWGVFPCPDMQCKGEQTLRYSIVPYAVAEKSAAYAAGRAFSGDYFTTACVGKQDGKLPSAMCYLGVQGEHVTMSALKKCEDRDSIILRLYNTDSAAHTAEISLADTVKAVYQTNLNENREQELPIENGKVAVPLGAKKIVTIELC